MSGHNKWSKIKRQKGAEDAAKSKLFGKLVRAITVEAKKSGVIALNKNTPLSPGLETAIKKARDANMPNDTIERAVKKSGESAAMEATTYEAYGPGGSALVIEALTSNRNKAAQEIKAILVKHGTALAAPGSATWAFEKTSDGWIAKTPTTVTEEDGTKLSDLVEELENNDEVQEVYTNAE
jgi:transcriptional/translational regulatory protein YebC/TACO1